MRNFLYVTLFFSLLFMSSCEWIEDKIDPKPDPLPRAWKVLGLTGKVVNQLYNQDSLLFAATNDGVYQKNILSSDTNWKAIGLSGQQVLDLIVFNQNEMLVCVEINQANSEASIYKTTNGGMQWMPYQNGFGGESAIITCYALEKDPSNRDVLYARSSSATAKSTDRGQSWQLVLGEWIGIGYQAPLIEVNPYYPNIVWSGGENAIFQPYLSKSSDNGQTWMPVDVPSNGDNAVYTVLNHPTDSSRVIVGMEGQLVYSSDGGANWRVLFEPSNYPYFLDLTNNQQKQIYATGSLNGTSGGHIFFYYSNDFGQNWQQVIDTKHASANAANDLLVRNSGSNQGLYFGTNQGVYWYSGFN